MRKYRTVSTQPSLKTLDEHNARPDMSFLISTNLQALIINLLRNKGYSYDSISVLIGIKPSTARSIVSRNRNTDHYTVNSVIVLLKQFSDLQDADELGITEIKTDQENVATEDELIPAVTITEAFQDKKTNVATEDEITYAKFKKMKLEKCQKLAKGKSKSKKQLWKRYKKMK